MLNFRVAVSELNKNRTVAKSPKVGKDILKSKYGPEQQRESVSKMLKNRACKR